MTSIRKLAAAMLAACGMSAYAADFSTPQHAIRSLEAAYIREDMEAAVAARDFEQEALLLLRHLGPDYARDAALRKRTTEALELSFRNEMTKKGFPDFRNLKCALGKARGAAPGMVRVTETCTFPDGGQSVQDRHVFHTADGWRVVNVPQ